MNLLGVICTLLQDTGLQSILELIYGGNADVHMILWPFTGIQEL